MTKKSILKHIFIALIFVCLAAGVGFAQVTEFTYQGTLKDNGAPANANYDLEFALFDASSGGNQIGATIPKSTVLVTNGVFAVKLDFGSVFPGANRYLETHVRLTGQPGFTILAPRQLINSAPYSIKTLNADTAANATNATQLGGVAAGQYVITTDTRMTDSRSPSAGSSNYIQNQNAGAQASSTFNISGDGVAGGMLSGTVVNSATQYNIGGSPAFVINGSPQSPRTNVFTGIGAGVSITPGGFFNNGISNSFYGTNSGNHTTTGINNAFFGADSGFNNVAGADNDFFGWRAGFSNVSGASNSFFGHAAGILNTASLNSFFGFAAGQNNTTGQNNTFIGSNAGNPDTSTQFNHSTAIGADATVSTSNTIVLGTNAETTQIPGGLTANVVNAATQYNIGGSRVLSVGGTDNIFAGLNAGSVNTGIQNSFFGANAGVINTTGGGNSFFGDGAGYTSTTGGGNSFFGFFAGAHSGLTMTGRFNSAFGVLAGQNNTNGDNNTAIGYSSNAGGNQSQSNATAVGFNTGATSTSATAVGSSAQATANSATALGESSSASGTNATAIGAGAIASGTNTTAIGAGATATVAHTIYIGTSAETTIVPGFFSVGTVPSGASGPSLCINGGAVIAFCSSSLRYKTNLAPYRRGLDIVNSLRPITFDWKQDGKHDVGFGAEDVAKVDPLLVFYNTKGEVEGVKYDRISTALVNAVKEQQTQIEDQKAKIALLEQQVDAQRRSVEALRLMFCAHNRSAKACKARK